MSPGAQGLSSSTDVVLKTKFVNKYRCAISGGVGSSSNAAPARLETLEPDSEVELIPGAQPPQQPPQQVIMSLEVESSLFALGNFYTEKNIIILTICIS